jgi:hypothetical protein
LAKNYSFKYIEGTSQPSKTIEAHDDEHAWDQIGAFLAEKPGRTLVSGSITMSEFRHVEDPLSDEQKLNIWMGV